MPDPSSFQEFIARHAKPYDLASDDYDRPPFAADIKEGKNDSIYNAHSYHTKVPPRSIIPYILHYTLPGDLILDPFCGSGMTGVAAQMCADPPADILNQFPELKARVGPRACILNDLSPAACHIAYNYNTPVDVEPLRREFARIKASVQDEFDWLYSTEHYEPAIGPYAPEALTCHGELFSSSDPARGNWTLLSRSEVEERLGYSVTELRRDQNWDKADVAKIERWVCIPAMIQYTIWSDVYRCEGFVSIEEPTINKRGKNAGQPRTTKKRAARGCGRTFALWSVARDHDTGEVHEVFKCQFCNVEWKKTQLPRVGAEPVVTNYLTLRLQGGKGEMKLARYRGDRKVTSLELRRLRQIESESIPHWVPDTVMDPRGPQYRRSALNVRGIKQVIDFWTVRNRRAFAALWEQADKIEDDRLRRATRFLLTSFVARVSRKAEYREAGGAGNTHNLTISSITREDNILKSMTAKETDVLAFLMHASRLQGLGKAIVRIGSATNLTDVPDQSIDYVFTDPPFGSNIYYSEPNLLWEVWLGETTDTKFEAVVHRKNDGGTKRLEDYAKLMAASFKEIYRVLKPNRYATIEFNNSDGSVFEAIKQALRDAGFRVVNMLLLDKKQKTFKQFKAAEIGEDFVDKDVLFNLHKLASAQSEHSAVDFDLELQIADIVREHLQKIPDRIKAEPEKYSEEYRTTATINSILMNALIPRGVGVERLNLPFIERVCGRFFRKVGQRWYLHGEAAGGTGRGGLIEEEVEIKDELSAIDWLRQGLRTGPKLIGEIKPLWMRAIGLLPAEISQTLILEDIVSENFWRDADTNRWREPTLEEREKMNDDRSLRVLHDAERFVNGTLRRPTTDVERAGWIDVIFQACRAVKDEAEALPTLRGFDPMEAYSLITRLFQSILSDHLTSDAWRKVEKQATASSRKIAFRANEQNVKATKPRGPEGGQEHFDFGKA